MRMVALCSRHHLHAGLQPALVCKDRFFMFSIPPPQWTLSLGSSWYGNQESRDISHFGRHDEGGASPAISHHTLIRPMLPPREQPSSLHPSRALERPTFSVPKDTCAEVLKGGRSTMPLWEEFSCGTVVGNVATMVHASAA